MLPTFLAKQFCLVNALHRRDRLHDHCGLQSYTGAAQLYPALPTCTHACANTICYMRFMTSV